MLATLSLLQALEPVALRLRAVPGLACAPGAELERSLRQLGLTTSINLQPVHQERSA